MARTNNLSNFLTDVANAIRSKTGETGEILASEFDNKIESIQTGSGNINEYFDTTDLTNYQYIIQRTIKEIPNSILQEISQNNNITVMSNIFSYCTTLTELDLSNFNTSNVTNMSSMFFYCTNLETINFGDNFNTSNVTTMSSMFSHCLKLTTIPKLNANKLENIASIFSNCIALTTFGGLENLGMAYSTTSSANYSTYRLALPISTQLTHTSLMNVINNLYDIATKGCNTQSLQLGTTNIAKLSEEEIAIATNKGWTVS